MENKEVFKISGTNIYLYKEYLFLDNEYYQQFYDIEELYKYAKKIQRAFNRIVIFRYFYDGKDIDLIIDRNTTLFNLKEKYNSKVSEIENEKRNKKERKIGDNLSRFHNSIDLYSELFESINIKTIKKLEEDISEYNKLKQKIDEKEDIKNKIKNLMIKK